MAYKQHFIEWFSGKQLPSYWDNESTGTYAMMDEVDGGFKITCANAGNANGRIHFNDKRQFDLTSSKFNSVAKKVDLDGSRTFYIGLSHHNVIGVDANNNYGFHYHAPNVSVYLNARSGNGSSTTNTSTGITMDTNFHALSAESTGTNTLHYVDGVLKVTNTETLPTGNGQPSFVTGQNNSGQTGSAQVRFYEAYNT